MFLKKCKYRQKRKPLTIHKAQMQNIFNRKTIIMPFRVYKEKRVHIIGTSAKIQNIQRLRVYVTQIQQHIY